MAIADKVSIVSTNGQKTQEAIRQGVERRMRPQIERARRNGVTWGDKVIEGARREDFSWKATFESINQMHSGRLNAETITLSQAASAINLVTVNDVYEDYESMPALYEQIAKIIPTNKVINEFPEMWADDLPRPVAELEPAPKARITGTSSRITTYEYAILLSISKRLYDNDDRGLIRDYVTRFAQSYKKVIDRAFIYKMFRELVPTDPRMPGTNVLGSNGGLVPSTAGAVTPQRIQDALTLAGYITDPFGEFLVITPDTIVVDTADEMNVNRFLTSMYSPVGFGASSTGYNADTSPGIFAQNILQGRLNIAHSPYVKTSRGPLGNSGYPALLMQAKTTQIVCMKQDLKITMEPPNAGDSFVTRSYNWLGELEFGTGNRNRRSVIIIN